MALADRPHTLGIDDGPFDKGQADPVRLVAVMMEGADLVESVAMASFPVDGDAATGFLSAWVQRLRAQRSIQVIVLGGITIAGLGVVDIRELAGATGIPVASVTRRDPSRSRLASALQAAGLADRLAIVENSPEAAPIGAGLFVSCAGAPAAEIHPLIRACLGKSNVPEPLRLAHLIARAAATGESRGRA